MFHDFAVQLAHSVTFRVAVIDYPVEVVQLAVLVICVKAGQVLCSHEISAQGSTVEALLAGCCGRYADDIWGVINCTKDLEHAVFSFSKALITVDRVHLTIFLRAQSGHLTCIVLEHD